MDRLRRPLLVGFTAVLIVWAGALVYLALERSGGGAASTTNEVAQSEPSTGPFRGSKLPDGLVGREAPNFRLSDARGQPVDTERLEGRPYLVTFLYTNCPPGDTCPTIAAELRQALDQLGRRADDVTVLAVSVEPKGDTPAAARRWLRRHRLPDNFRFLVGSRRELKPVWKSYYAAPQTPSHEGDRHSHEESRHSANMWLVDARGRWRTKFSAASRCPRPTSPTTSASCSTRPSARSMVDAPGMALAFAAGFVSFVSPCCLPLVPGYLAAVGGPRPGDGRRLDRRVLGRSLAFVGTFSVIFVFLGLTATALGALLFDSREALNAIAGVLIVAMGLLFIGSVAVVRLNREWRPEWLVARAGRGGPVVAGASFAVAWTPCVGPTLGAVLGLAATQATVGQGAILLAIYSAGLGVPFLLSSLAYTAGTQRFSWLRRRYPLLQVASGIVLLAMGGLVLSGELFRLNIEVQQALDGLGLNIWQSL